jgi:hypothetical protein
MVSTSGQHHQARNLNEQPTTTTTTTSTDPQREKVLVTNSHAATYEASPQYYNVPQDIKCNNLMMAIS